MNFTVPTKALRSEKAFIALDPIAGDDDIGAIWMERSITVAELKAVLKGGTSPTATYDVFYNTSRVDAGSTSVKGSGSAVSSTTTGDSETSLSNATIPAARWVWLDVSAVSGDPDELSVTMIFDYV